MTQKTKCIPGLILFVFLCVSFAYADETALFTTVAPDALILLDLSGSMAWNPAGGSHVYGNSSCSGSTFYSSPSGDYSTDCSRVSIAKRALFDLLDDNQDDQLDKHDESSWNIRFGYMRYYDCSSDETDGDYSSGCIRKIRDIGSKYSRIFCDNSTSCARSDGTTCSLCCTDCIKAEGAWGGTPLASALHEAKLYLDYDKSRDASKDCRQKFVILITDGADTLACSGDGTESQSTQYKRRIESVRRAKELAAAGYKVFVIGFGSAMPAYLQNTLNWMAYYGGTDNPVAANTGDKAAFNPDSIASCADSTVTGTCPDCFATTGDPGNLSLGGYAFIATDADQLTNALRSAVNMIREANYSFSTASVASSRLRDENNLYEGSFQPVNEDPFWLGHLKKYAINDDGTVGSVVWDAGSILRDTAAGSRNMKTYISGTLVDFNTANVSKSVLGISTDTGRSLIIGFVRGEEDYNKENWKLGDVFRSAPMTIGSPSPYFSDSRDTSGAFATFRSLNERTSLNGKRLIVAGANDGQLHAFATGTGVEAWSFVPPNLLPSLKNIAHADHPTSLLHKYFVDGPVTVADAWLGTGDGRTKNASDWKTLMIFGEGRGGASTLWSSSSYCDGGFNSIYSTSTYNKYCGFYAFDVTDTLYPAFKWILNTTDTNGVAAAPYLGEPWGKYYIGRVLINGNEKWVGFISGGYNGSDCSGGGVCREKRGKAFLVVDLANGNILWSYKHSDNENMDYSMPGSPAIVDSDNDGFIDTAYIGDLGSNVWRFKFCGAASGSSCGTSSWTGGILFQSSSDVIRPIFTTPSVARDARGNLWVYWGTGDKTDPTAASAQERFFAVKDNDRSSTWQIGNLENITTGTYADEDSKHGWFINLAGHGEKILGEPAVFGGVVYFTTYTPASGGNPCDQAGDAKLYAVNYMTGGGIFESGDRSMDIGSGIPTSPVISLKPSDGSPDLYVTVSGGSGEGASTRRASLDPRNVANRTNVLYWKDGRLK